MTQEEKELLLIDLSARLPYGVEVVYLATTYTIQYIDKKFGEVKLNGLNCILDIGHIKPYLRPMSSMTEEEKEDIEETFTFATWAKVKWYDAWKSIEWLNAHHFDYRGFIEKGLAIEAPKDMYK